LNSVLDEKIIEQFGEVVIDKRFSRLEIAGRIPRYLFEYIMTARCGTTPDENDIAHLVEYIDLMYPQPEDRDRVLHELMTKGEYLLFDELKVITDIRRSTYWVKIPSLGMKASILESIINKYKGLLTSGMWGLARLKYRAASPNETSSANILVSEFIPFELVDIPLSGFAERRRNFTLDEWLDLLTRTIGLNPDAYGEEQKILLISRLIPLVENNCNMLELGPKATGKTYLYRNISFYSRVISGEMVSPATLFYNIARDIPGEICMRDCIVFDEIKNIQFLGFNKIIGKLKDYMTDGFFERGPKKASSNCSLVFLANIELNHNPQTGDFNKALPEFMHDTAFIDRLDGLLPGWKLPKLKQSKLYLADGLGLVIHYFCEILHKLRKKHFHGYIEKRVNLKGNLSIRDERGIKKIASGLLKILAPDGNFTHEELELAVQTGINFRQKIAEWLHRLSPNEFDDPHFEYEITY